MINLPADRPLDVICLGRAGMDLHAREQDTDFFAVSGFDKHLGGSPANIALGMARLGKKVGFIGAVSNDPVGNYVRTTLQAEGIDTSGISTDNSGSRTSLALTEMRAAYCAVVIYRNHAADLTLRVESIDPGYIARARMLLISGTALCQNPSRSAVFAAVSAAHAAGTRVVLDLDYRDYGWADSATAIQYYWQLATQSHCLIGNREEFAVIGISGDAASAAQQCFARTPAGVCDTVCIKAGAAGSTLFLRDGSAMPQAAFAVPVKKPFGAGDAYAAALLAGLCEGRPWSECLHRGSAAAAIVVAANCCGEASPDTATLEQFLAAGSASLPPA